MLLVKHIASQILNENNIMDSFINTGHWVNKRLSKKYQMMGWGLNI